jgi:hypothetical protein
MGDFGDIFAQFPPEPYPTILNRFTAVDRGQNNLSGFQNATLPALPSDKL